MHLSFSINDNEFEMVRKAEKMVAKIEGEWVSTDDLEGRSSFLVRRMKRSKAPAQEAEALAKIADKLSKDDQGAYTSTLKEKGVRELYFSYQRDGLKITDVSGKVKIWLKGGKLAKYEYNVKGHIDFNEGERTFDLDRTTTVEVKAVGKTKVSIAEAAQKLLK